MILLKHKYLLFLLLAAIPLSLATYQSPLVKLKLKSVPNNRGLYYGEVLIGQPADAFKLLICTVCNTTWIPSYTFRGYFDQVHLDSQQKSRARNPSWVAYNDIYSEMAIRMVDMQIGDANMGKVPVGVAMDILNPELLAQYTGLSGVLGLNGATTEILPTNPVDNMFKLGFIKHNIVSLHLRHQPPASVDTPSGLLTFGGVDPSLFLGELHHVPMRPLTDRLDNMGWALHANDIKLDWSALNDTDRPKDTVIRYRFPSISEEQPARLFPDTTTPYFVGYKRYLDKYLIRFMGAKRFGLAGNYVFEDCRPDNKPDFVFSLEADKEIRIKPRDYLINYKHYNGRHYCLAAFIGIEANEWTLGTQFFRNYFTVFDYDDNRFGFAIPRRSKKETI